MAKRKKGRRGHRTGSVITTRRLNGLGNIKQPSSLAGAVVPPLAAGIVTGGVTVAAEQLITPDGTGGAMDMLHNYAPLVGLVAGGMTSLALRYMAGKPQALAGLTASVMVSGTLLLKRYIESAPATAGMGYMYRGHRQMGAVVAEQLNGLPAGGMGAIVMEPYGQQGYGNPGGGARVSLGAINPSAFGTPGFDM